MCRHDTVGLVGFVASMTEDIRGFARLCLGMNEYFHEFFNCSFPSYDAVQSQKEQTLVVYIL
jgi:hypothetical protein